MNEIETDYRLMYENIGVCFANSSVDFLCLIFIL